MCSASRLLIGKVMDSIYIPLIESKYDVLCTMVPRLCHTKMNLIYDVRLVCNRKYLVNQTTIDQRDETLKPYTFCDTLYGVLPAQTSSLRVYYDTIGWAVAVWLHGGGVFEDCRKITFLKLFI